MNILCLRVRQSFCLVLLAILLVPHAFAASAEYPTPKDGEYVVHNFHFKDGETIPELRLHYVTLGTPVRDSSGRVTNAVLIMHGTTGSTKAFTTPYFAGELFGPGQLLDATRYFIIIPDAIGHGGSSKPSDGLKGRFPHYDYDDMVAAQHAVVSQALGVNHLRLAMGTSMGCMHSTANTRLRLPRRSSRTMPTATPKAARFSKGGL